jgi:hypothetical protein
MLNMAKVSEFLALCGANDGTGDEDIITNGETGNGTPPGGDMDSGYSNHTSDTAESMAYKQSQQAKAKAKEEQLARQLAEEQAQKEEADLLVEQKRQLAEIMEALAMHEEKMCTLQFGNVCPSQLNHLNHGVARVKPVSPKSLSVA